MYAAHAVQDVAQIAREHPTHVEATLAAADRVCRHEFDVLGSGPFVSVDPGRPSRAGYTPIDWYRDPVTGLRFPERVPYKHWNLLAMRPGLADVKLPWELARCQHWLPVAQAFAIGAERRFATEILDQHDDFVEANPVGFGINWTCTMDVALRALNWALAIEIVQSAASDSAERFERAYVSLFDHGAFIERNLENTYEVTSNHFLSNVVGLYALGLLFQDLESGSRWLRQCRDWLEQEMRVQVLDDGADYESSIPYHRLVTELFLSAWRLSICEGARLSAAYRTKLESMVEFLHAVLRPDGRLPQVGDADDGRVHVFSEYGTWEPQDARHIFAPAGALLDRPEWAAIAGDWGAWEALWWGTAIPSAHAAPPAETCRLFPAAGLAVVKDRRQYLLITNGVVGTNGFGNHKHNDLLSFEFHHDGVPLIVDPGSYVYTSDPDARNRFRSTASHNTLVVDDVEQNELKPEWLFRMFEKARPEHVEFTATAAEVRYRGRHDGYARLPAPVEHQRAFSLDRQSGALSIADRVTGSGTHDLRWLFQCAPGVEVEALAGGQTRLRADSRQWLLHADSSLARDIGASWYSPSYGVKQAAAAIAFRTRADLATPREWSFRLELCA